MIMGLGDAAGTQAVASVRALFQKNLNELSARFDPALTLGQLYTILQEQQDRALQFQAQNPPNRATLDVKVAALTKVRNEAKVARNAAPGAPAPRDMVERGRIASLDVIKWLAQLSGAVLADSNADADTVRTVWSAIVNAPGSVLGWAGEQLGGGVSRTLVGMGLPSWLLPVALLGAGLVVVAPYAAPMIARAISSAGVAHARARVGNSRRSTIRRRR